MNRQKTQLEIKKNDGKMMMSLILLVRSINYGRSGNGNINEKYLEANKKARRAGRPIV